MYESGESIYFKRPEDSRARKGEVIGHIDGMYQIKGARSATQHTRPVYLIPVDQVFPVQEIGRNKPVKYHREFHGVGLSVPTEESLQRKMAVIVRMGMDEGAVLFSEPMQRLCRQTVRRLCRSNGINQQHAEYNELTAEYFVSGLQAIRTSVFKADESDIEDFKRFIAGEDHVLGRIVLTVARTAKTAVVRFLKQRQQYHQCHVSIDSLEGRLAA